MTIALLVLGLGGFWVFLLWRVRVERGRVRSDVDVFARFARRMRDLEEAIGAALLPAIESYIRALEAFARAFSR